jgi:hypothetical protein
MTEELIQYISKCYFWVFLVMLILTIIYQSTDDYKMVRKINVQLGKESGNFTITHLITWILFLLSIKLM